MEDLFHSSFIHTVLSADISTEPAEAMENYQELYMAATSLLSGDWRTAGLEYSTVLIHLNLKRRGEKWKVLELIDGVICLLKKLDRKNSERPARGRRLGSTISSAPDSPSLTSWEWRCR